MGEISKKVQESRLKWYGHVLRREDEYVGKSDGPKRRWLDSIAYGVIKNQHFKSTLLGKNIDNCGLLSNLMLGV